MARTEDKSKKSNGQAKSAPPARVYETGPEAFTRIAESRVNVILAKLNTLSKLASGKSKYGYTDGDVECIRATLVKAVNATCDRLSHKAVNEGFRFERKGGESGASA